MLHSGHNQCCVFLVLIIHHLRQGLTIFLKQKTSSYITLACLVRSHDALQQFILFRRHVWTLRWGPLDGHHPPARPNSSSSSKLRSSWSIWILFPKQKRSDLPMFISYEPPFCPKKGSSINRVRQRKPCRWFNVPTRGACSTRAVCSTPTVFIFNRTFHGRPVLLGFRRSPHARVIMHIRPRSFNFWPDELSWAPMQGGPLYQLIYQLEV